MHRTAFGLRGVAADGRPARLLDGRTGEWVLLDEAADARFVVKLKRRLSAGEWVALLGGGILAAGLPWLTGVAWLHALDPLLLMVAFLLVLAWRQRRHLRSLEDWLRRQGPAARGAARPIPPNRFAALAGSLFCLAAGAAFGALAGVRLRRGDVEWIGLALRVPLVVGAGGWLQVASLRLRRRLTALAAAAAR